MLTWVASRTAGVEDEVAGLVGSGGVCLDVGAEYGLCTWVLSALAGPSGHVRPAPRAGCASPHASSAAPTSPSTTTRSAPARATANSACPVGGDCPSKAGPTSAKAPKGPARTPSSAPPAPTLDDLVRGAGVEKVAFVKADAEGAALGVLDGAHETLTAHRPALLLEIEARHLRKYGAGPKDVTRRRASTTAAPTCS